MLVLCQFTRVFARPSHTIIACSSLLIRYWQTPGVCANNVTWSGSKYHNVLHSVCSSASDSDDPSCAVSCYNSEFDPVDLAHCYEAVPTVTDGDASYTAKTLDFLEYGSVSTADGALTAYAYVGVKVDPPRPLEWAAVRAAWSAGRCTHANCTHEMLNMRFIPIEFAGIRNLNIGQILTPRTRFLHSKDEMDSHKLDQSGFVMMCSYSIRPPLQPKTHIPVHGQ